MRVPISVNASAARVGDRIGADCYGKLRQRSVRMKAIGQGLRC